jgi:outer membrane immunogenic protein
MIMKKVLLAAFISAAIPNVVLAADLYTKAPPPAGFDWTGLYIGGHVGGGWATNEFSDSFFPTGNTLPELQKTNSSGFLGGVQGGANYQIGRLVLGTDFDFSWASINGRNTASYGLNSFAPPAFDHSQTLGADTDWIGTATTRLGVARNNWLLYSKAGVAWGHTNYTENNTNVVTGFDQFDGTGSKTLTGWTVGTGIEWAFAYNWTAKLEYDYIDFGSNIIGISGTRDPGQPFAHPQSFTTVNDQTISEVKFGVNYKFPPGWALFW